MHDEVGWLGAVLEKEICSGCALTLAIEIKRIAATNAPTNRSY
jgi:hypothetical protein